MIKPLKNRVVAKLEKPEIKTASGILLGEAKEKSAYAVIESVGPDVSDLKTGDKILYKEYTATEVKINNQSYLILEDKDILATL
jgi:chaperonin GroES